MLRVKVGSVDMYGLCGRDKHPRASDEGRSGRVDKYEVLDLNEGAASSEAELVGWYTVTLDDNALDVRQVELAEWEVATVLRRTFRNRTAGDWKAGESLAELDARRDEARTR